MNSEKMRHFAEAAAWAEVPRTEYTVHSGNNLKTPEPHFGLGWGEGRGSGEGWDRTPIQRLNYDGLCTLCEMKFILKSEENQ